MARIGSHMIGRRSFLTLGACPAVSALAQTPAQAPAAPAAAAPLAAPALRLPRPRPPPAPRPGAVGPPPIRYFGFTAQIVLGAAYYRGGDPGKLLAILAKI